MVSKYLPKDTTNSFKTVQGFEKVRGQIQNILNVPLLFFPGHPEYFFDNKLLFELNDSITHVILSDQIRYSLMKYINEIDQVDVELEAQEENIVAVIKYYSTELQQNDIYRYPLMYDQDA